MPDIESAALVHDDRTDYIMFLVILNDIFFLYIRVTFTSG